MKIKKAIEILKARKNRTSEINVDAITVHNLAIESLKKELENKEQCIEQSGADKAIKEYIYKNKDAIIEKIVDRATTEIIKKEQMFKQLSTNAVIDDVIQERKHQDIKWGQENHCLPLWTSIIGEEYGELCQAIYETILPTQGREPKGGYNNMRTEAIQLAAVAIKFIEYLDRKELGTNG